jgi:GNAT superfamily N-acetyltransferase
MDRNSPTVRPALQGDLDTLVELLQELFAIEQDFAPDPDRQRKGLMLFLEGCGKHRCVLVAEWQGRVVGMAILQILISTGEGEPVGLVEDVVVQTPYRGRGIGKCLLEALADWAVAHGLVRLQLLADRENRPALDFYHRIGWVNTQLVCLRKASLDARGSENES